MIRPTTPSDSDAIYAIHSKAFGQSDEADLVKALMSDPTAEPRVSLLATGAEGPLGHILFTATHVDDLRTAILCPMAVVPSAQGKGIGGALIREGLGQLRAAGCDAVLVLGHPGYYPRHGFEPDAGAQGFAAPYPIPPEHAAAWMVCHLSDATGAGPVRCADTLMDEKYWVE